MVSLNQQLKLKILFPSPKRFSKLEKCWLHWKDLNAMTSSRSQVLTHSTVGLFHAGQKPFSFTHNLCPLFSSLTATERAGEFQPVLWMSVPFLMLFRAKGDRLSGNILFALFPLALYEFQAVGIGANLEICSLFSSLKKKKALPVRLNCSRGSSPRWQEASQ